MSDAVDRSWIEWARPIVRIRDDSPEHFAWCERKLGADRYTDLDPTLRWPCYVGGNWEVGKGVLFIGSVHSDFRGIGDRADREPIVHAMAESNARWRDLDSPTREDDNEYLTCTRRAYESLLPFWPRADLFRDLLTTVFGDGGHPFSHAAWTNLAHCRSKPKAIREYSIQLQCSSERGVYPISDLIRRLWPAAILISIKPVETTYPHRYDFQATKYQEQMPAGYVGPIVRVFPGMLDPDWNGQPSDVWIPQLAASLQRGRHDRRAQPPW